MRMQEVNEWRLGTIVNERYEILGLMGKSCSSTTWLARDAYLERQWVIKSYEFDELDSADGINAKMSSINLLKSIDHPNIVRIVDAISDGHSIYIVMDYVEGVSLEKQIKISPPLPENVVIDIAVQLCDVLQYLHNYNPPVFFGDLHPEDIILHKDGRTIKLVNFDVTQRYYRERLIDDESVGTQIYVAPELHSNPHELANTESDIYSLGIILYSLLSGRICISGDHSHVRKDNPSVSYEFEAIVSRATSIDEALRYHNVRELLYDLNSMHRPHNTDCCAHVRAYNSRGCIIIIVAVVIFIVFGILFFCFFSKYFR